KYLGFYPDTFHGDAPYFDLQEGEFSDDPGDHPALEGQNLEYLKTFLGTNFDGFHSIPMGKTERQSLLKDLVLYFELHLHGFKKPRSLAVLNEVFS
ncbi:MAG: DNA repair protein RecO C-terminal domain-containing protein, partial [Bacteroidota bacterium]